MQSTECSLDVKCCSESVGWYFKTHAIDNLKKLKSLRKLVDRKI